MLKSHFYYGLIEYKGEFYEGKHEPLISKELFEQVQIAFKKDNKPKYKDTKDFLFAGMITCADCGCQISGEIKKENMFIIAVLVEKVSVHNNIFM